MQPHTHPVLNNVSAEKLYLLACCQWKEAAVDCREGGLLRLLPLLSERREKHTRFEFSQHGNWVEIRPDLQECTSYCLDSGNMFNLSHWNVSEWFRESILLRASA